MLALCEEAAGEEPVAGFALERAETAAGVEDETLLMGDIIIFR